MATCRCGCGNPVPIAKHANPKYGYKFGEPVAYLRGHSQIKYRPAEGNPPLCACGCHKPVSRYTKTNKKIGQIKGQWSKYLVGHVAKKSSVLFTIERRGHSSACWIWGMNKTDSGYGLKGSRLAHRHYYEMVNGKVPFGLELDHLCSNRDCIRPDHLEPVTRSVNMKRAFARRGAIEKHV